MSFARYSSLSEREEKPINFDSALNYDDILESMKQDFEARWMNVMPAPFLGLDDHEYISILGVGAFGRVSLFKNTSTSNVCAVKFLLKEKVVKLKQIKHVYNEKQILHSCNFPFLVSLLFSRKDNNYLYLGLPYHCGGELFSYHRKMKKFNEHQAKFYSSQVFLALEYMHSNSVIYRDLKPENILIARSGYIRITDFGFAKRIHDRTHTLCGTPEYFAPEIIKAKPYGFSVDWWAFGVFIYELVAGHSPFQTHNNDLMIMYTKICDCNYKMPLGFSPSLQHLVTNLLECDTSKRYGNMFNGNKDIKNHPWFSTVNWFAMLNQLYEPYFIPKIFDDDDISYFDAYKVTEDVLKQVNVYADVFEDF